MSRWELVSLMALLQADDQTTQHIQRSTRLVPLLTHLCMGPLQNHHADIGCLCLRQQSPLQCINSEYLHTARGTCFKVGAARMLR